MIPHDVVELAKELVAFPSVTGDEGAIAQMIGDRLRAAGWHVTLQPVPPEKEGGPARFNLLAVDDPSITPELVLTTHLDTVPPFIAPTEDDEYLYGRGTCDAKGIFAAQWIAAERLRAAGKRGIALLGVAGEETDSVGAKMVPEVLPKARFVIDGEPTDLDMTSGAKGILALKLTAKGIAGHSAYPEQGVSASHALIRALARLLDAKLPFDPEFGETTVNVGVMQGGVAPNVISPAASALVMIRLGDALDRVLQEVRRVLGPDLDVEVTSGSEPQRIHVPAGRTGKVVRFGSDVPYLAKVGTTLLVGPGSILDAHTSGEKVSKRALRDSVELYVALGDELLGGVK
ncbi:M20/M25/M40 family metallo-hydrolase [Myxococcota bacterium]|nr:M20/M25/M40 family metallo-hydrolase [Myxococcota bacterium]